VLVSAARAQRRHRETFDGGRASFGLACALSVVVLGDESGYLAGENQKMKIAAIEAEWRTENHRRASPYSDFPTCGRARHTRS